MLNIGIEIYLKIVFYVMGVGLEKHFFDSHEYFSYYSQTDGIQLAKTVM